MTKPINVYYAPVFTENQDWTFLYPKPKILFNNLLDYRTEESNPHSMLSCPALSNKIKKILVFESPMSFKINYNWNNRSIDPVTKNYINAEYIREPSFNFGPCICFSLGYIFFAEEDLDAYFTPPMFHKPMYTKYGSVIPGEFNIGKWFRAYNFEIQTWSNFGSVEIEEDEPLFYVEFKTDKPVNLYRFNMTNRIYEYSEANVRTTDLFGRGQSLLSRYARFEKVGFREKILTEIKKNLIEEDPFEL
jgi:hypothetical protein